MFVRRAGRWLSAAAAALAFAGCTAGGGGTSAKTIDPGASHAPTSLTVWGAFTTREASIVQASLDRLHAQLPWLTVKYVGGKSDEDVSRAIAGGNPPDVVMAQGPDNVAKYCSTGAWVDLDPYLQASKIDVTKTFVPASLTYTSHRGIRCALPLLTDAYGLYYNKKLLASAGIGGPPKTIAEFVADAKKLTRRGPDGSISVLGFAPLAGFYEAAQLYNGINFGVTWYGTDGKAAFGTDPRWAQAFTFAKQMTDSLGGYSTLQRFLAPYNAHEFDAGNAFEKGKLAFLYDGEWRPAFVQADKVRLDYGSAPFPVPDDLVDRYGMGQVGGTVIGIPRGARHPAEGWLAVKFLTTDDQTLTTLAEDLRNVPTTFTSLRATKLSGDPLFQPFIEIATNKHSSYKSITPLGSADEDAVSQFMTAWQQGKVSNLQEGLTKLAAKVDKLAAQG